MSTTPQNDSTVPPVPGEHRKVIMPLRLIFWGIIISLPTININGFTGVNDFIGSVLMLWGIVVLSRIPISDQYQRWMWLPTVISIVWAISMLFPAFLQPLQLVPSPPPSNVGFAFFILLVFVSLLATITFCGCMAQYCSVMNWERTLASWRYSTRLFTFGVLFPFAIAAIPLYFFLSSLEWLPKNAPDIQWESERIGEKWEDGMRYAATKCGKVIYSEVVMPTRDSEGRYCYTMPKLDPPHNIGTINFGDMVAPLERKIIWWVPAIILAVIVFWAHIHILMSLSRMIRAAEPAATEPAINSDLQEAITDTRLRRNLHGPFKTAEEAVAAMTEE